MKNRGAKPASLNSPKELFLSVAIFWPSSTTSSVYFTQTCIFLKTKMLAQVWIRATLRLFIPSAVSRSPSPPISPSLPVLAAFPDLLSHGTSPPTLLDVSRVQRAEDGHCREQKIQLLQVIQRQMCQEQCFLLGQECRSCHILMSQGGDTCSLNECHGSAGEPGGEHAGEAGEWRYLMM